MTFLSREIQLPRQGDHALSEGAEPAAGPLRTGETCQWIDGAVTGDDACKCGRPVIGRLPGRAPYCPEHARRCFESAAAWKARNAFLADLDGGFARVSLQDWIGGLE